MNKKILSCIRVVLILGIIAGLIGCAESGPKPPIAKKVKHIEEWHGQEYSDDYFWLRDKENPEVISYLEAENTYTDSIMSHTKPFQDKLFTELRGRIVEDDIDAPVKIDSFYYYSRTEKEKQYRIYCRKLHAITSEEQIILDVNELAEGKDYYDLGNYIISPNHKLMAYTVDITGDEHYTLYIKNLITGELLKDVIADMDGRAVWASDNKTIFYTTLDEINRPNKLFRHVLGHLPKNDVMVFHEKDDSFGLYVSKTLSRNYLLLGLWANNSSEYYFLRADRPTGKFKLIKERQPGVEYEVTHRDGLFYILTNENALNFKVMTVPVNKLSSRNWKELIPHRDSVLISGFIVLKNYLALTERENGVSQVWIRDFSSGNEHYIEFPEPIYTVSTRDNAMINSPYLRLSYQSMITPRTVYDYDISNKSLILRKQKEVRGSFDKTHYITKRLFAIASDGTKIPMSVMYKKGVKLNGSNPLYLYSYGAYGMNTEPTFSSYRLSLIDRGFVYVKAQIRGGSEMGRWWYEQGKLKNKMNTFTDFIACAEYLIAEGYTSKEKLVINGGSAGGLLIGGVVNMRPDLFYIAVADVPFVDVMNTMMDPTIPLTINEYTEWGNPNEKEYFDYMMSYSPYDNVEAKIYPNMLITAGLNDPRVQYWEPAKWTAKLRAMKTDTNRLCLKTNMGAGHMGVSGRYDYIKEIAFEYAFILDLLNRTQ
ncbi:MAG: S9 family peptidase [candidate division Zixibacteria bacterium]|nr:S9 family peptidase [candidate division Zixibacteria bacterium]